MYKRIFKESITYPEANKILKPYGFRIRKGKGYVYFDGIVPEATLTHDSLETFDIYGWTEETLIDVLLSRIVEADFEFYKNSVYGKRFAKQLKDKAKQMRMTWSIYYD